MLEGDEKENVGLAYRQQANDIAEEHECVETKTLKAKLRCYLQFVFHYLFWEIFETLHW
jgi:hypothetical protein